MTTLIIENADKKNAALIAQLAKALGLSVTKKEVSVMKRSVGVITNPELIRRIETSEAGKTKRRSFKAEELSVEIGKLTIKNA